MFVVKGKQKQRYSVTAATADGYTWPSNPPVSLPRAPQHALAEHNESTDSLSYLNELEQLQRFLSELLGVHVLSNAIIYRPHQPPTVSNVGWWKEVQQQSIARIRRRERRDGATTKSDSAAIINSIDSIDGIVRMAIRRSANAEGTLSVDVFIETFQNILRALDRVNRRRGLSGSDSKGSTFSSMVNINAQQMDELLGNVNGAIGFTGAKLLERWQAMTETISAATDSEGRCKTIAHTFSKTVINVILQYSDVGTLHTFHEHVLIASNPRDAFGAGVNWTCSICDRVSVVLTDGPSPTAYRCTPCNFQLCRECFTRIPNCHLGPNPPMLYQEKLSIQRFLVLVVPYLSKLAQFGAIWSQLAIELRCRVLEIYPHRSKDFSSFTRLLLEILEVPAAAVALLKSPSIVWLPPPTVPSWMSSLRTFLGPFLCATTMSDTSHSIDSALDTSPQALSVQWDEGFHTVKENLIAIMRMLLSHSQEPVVMDATLAWLGVTLMSINKRRRMNHDINDLMDGFLINLTSTLVTWMLPVFQQQHVGRINPNYHLVVSVPLRAYGDKDFHEVPLRDLRVGDRGKNYLRSQKAIEEARLQEHDRNSIAYYKKGLQKGMETYYYPANAVHEGVGCDHCNMLNFNGPRYKCAFCANVDLCGSCFDLFLRQSMTSEGKLDHNGSEQNHQQFSGTDRTSLDTNNTIHNLDHVFIRVDVPIPIYNSRAFEWIVFEIDKFPRDTDVSMQCTECHSLLHNAQVMYKCANCIDCRFLCDQCLFQEESCKSPHGMHVPGHLYFAITRGWARLHYPGVPNLHLRQLLHPPALLPRFRFEKETELFHMTIKCLHFGPLFTLSRLISILREIQELQAFCSCEEEKFEYEKLQRRASARRDGRRATRRWPFKMSTHYNASKARLGELRVVRAKMELHLVNSTSVTGYLMFYTHTCRWLLERASPSQDAFKDVLTDFSFTFSMFPEHFFFDLCDVVYLLGSDLLGYHELMDIFSTEYGLHDGSQVGSTVVEPLLVMLAQLVVSKQSTKNPHLRMQALKSITAVLSFFARSKSNRIVEDVFQRNHFLDQFTVSGILAFHEDMETYNRRNNGFVFNNNSSSNDHVLWGFLPTRISVTLLLRYLWQMPSQRDRIVQHLETDRSRMGQSVEGPSLMQSPMVVLISSLWGDIAKLLEEGSNKIATLRHLAELMEEASLYGNPATLPFRPAMMDGYVALQSKHLRLTFRMLVEVVESLAWLADGQPLRKTLLKSELVEPCTRTISFLLSSLATAFESKTWEFSMHLIEDSKLLLANVVALVVRCAGLEYGCSPTSFWKLIRVSGHLMINRIGDLDTHSRWNFNTRITRLESERYMNGDNDNHQANGASDSAQQIAHEEEELDENEALALLEKQASEAVVRATSSSSLTDHRGKDASALLGKRFIASLAKDGRFNFERFVACCEILKRKDSDEGNDYEIIGKSWVQKFTEAMNKSREMIELHASMDALLEDVPEDYLDPLMNTIMANPVRLPSGKIVDRAVIERHLMTSNPVDPFSREPLTMDMLVPCDTLRQEIKLYLRNKLRQMKSSKEDLLATWGLGWDYLFEDNENENCTV